MTAEEVESLLFEAEREKEDFLRLHGSPILFGQRISLRHDSTRRVVSFTNRAVDTHTSAGNAASDQVIGETAMCATLEATNGKDIMRIMPGFYVRMEGERTQRALWGANAHPSAQHSMGAVTTERMHRISRIDSLFIFGQVSESATETSSS